MTGLNRAPGVGESAAREWPTKSEALLACLLAILAVTVDIQISQGYGLLAYPPGYDGAYYLLEARSSFHRLPSLVSDPVPVLFDLFGGRFPFYKWLMIVNFLVLGDGEWQAYAVRFWPVFLVLLLVSWVVRRRAGPRLAVAASILTALLPTLSNGLRSASAQTFQGVSFGRTWYLSDLRPDLLFAALLTCAVVVLVEHAHSVSPSSWLVSGICAALAVLSKSSALPILLVGWGLAVLYVLFVNRAQFWRATRIAVWGIAAFVLMLVPWLVTGGAYLTSVYLYELLTIRRATYSSAQASALSEALFYWEWFPYHMGLTSGWLLLGAALFCFLVLLGEPKSLERSRLAACLVTSTAIYLVVSATPTKNFFLGLTFYLLLWVFCLATLSLLAREMVPRYRVLGSMIVAAAVLYGAVVTAQGIYALQKWPSEKRTDGSHNRATTLQMAADLRSALSNDDTFMSLPAYGFPNALQYYMVDESGGYPKAVAVDTAVAPPAEQYIRETATSCQAVLVYAEDIEEVADSRFVYIYPPRIPYLRAIAQWVRQPGSQYQLRKVYRFSHYHEGVSRILTVHLYVREREKAPTPVKP